MSLLRYYRNLSEFQFYCTVIKIITKVMILDQARITRCIDESITLNRHSLRVIPTINHILMTNTSMSISPGGIEPVYLWSDFYAFLTSLMHFPNRESRLVPKVITVYCSAFNQFCCSYEINPRNVWSSVIYDMTHYPHWEVVHAVCDQVRSFIRKLMAKKSLHCIS